MWESITLPIAKNQLDNPYQYVLFDLDGTLLDSALDISHALNQLRGKYGLPALPYATIRPLVSIGSPGLLKLCFDVGPDHPHFPALREEFFQFYERYLGDNSQLFAGVATLLTKLEQQGIKWGIVTNKITRLTKSILKIIDLLERPAVLVCADTLANKKPHPEPLYYACKKIGCAPYDTIYIGDAKNDVVAAHAAGMPAAIVSYGYIPEDGVDPATWGAEHMFASVSALQHFLLPKA